MLNFLIVDSREDIAEIWLGVLQKETVAELIACEVQIIVVDSLFGVCVAFEGYETIDLIAWSDIEEENTWDDSVGSIGWVKLMNDALPEGELPIPMLACSQEAFYRECQMEAGCHVDIGCYEEDFKSLEDYLEMFLLDIYNK